MSHFSVIVCLPAGVDPPSLEDRLSDVMARWDENREVDEYRDYEKGAPGEFWWVSSVRRAAVHLRDGTGIKPHDPDMLGWSSARSKLTAHEQRAEFAEDAEWAAKLGDNPTWETVVRFYNEKYHPGSEVALADDTSASERLHYDPESERAYTLSTRNPEGFWDYWRIGGRWRDYFVAKEKAAGLIFSAQSWDSPKEAPDDLLRCDGGPRRLLDFNAMRAAADRQANERFDRWEKVCADTPPALPWSHFAGLAELGELAWDDARRQYREQPRIQRANGDNLLRFDCPVAEFLSGREEYVAEARRAAVPGYALVTLEGEWLAPGRMGWFGMSSESDGERSAFRFGANRYLEDLDPNAYVVVLDCHV